MRAAKPTKLPTCGVYGVAEPSALAFAFGYHLGGFFPITIIGLYYAWSIGFSVRDVRAGEVSGYIRGSEENSGE